MKRAISIITLVTVIITCLFTFTACSDNSKFKGEWKATIDLTDEINKELAQEETTAEFVKISDFSIVLNAKFNSNGTYSLSVDEESLSDVIENAENDIRTGIEGYLKFYLKSMNIDVSLEEAIGENETTIEEMVNNVFSDELIDSILDEFRSEGRFRAQDGKLYMSDSVDHRIDKEVYNNYAISNTQLTLTEGSAPTEEELNIYPLIFDRIS